MHKPLIGITAGEITNKSGKWAPFTHGQSYTYIDAIINAGGVPIVLPITGDETIWRDFYEHCDGFLFAGGNDIDPKRYGQKKSRKTKAVSAFRDAQEFGLMGHVLAGDKPVLAICRGMQLLNIACGGTLFQHIPEQLPEAEDHEKSTSEKDTRHLAHTLQLKLGTKLAGYVGTGPLSTNTHHHQAVDKVGEGLVETAWAADGIIEGIELPGERFVIGVQSHPESLESDAEPRWAKLFAAFVKAAEQE